MLGIVELVSIWSLSGRRIAGSAVAGRLSERESGLDGVPVGCSGGYAPIVSCTVIVVHSAILP